ncbi:MAG: alpha/beta hydrolase [Phycisphaerae bacterium]
MDTVIVVPADIQFPLLTDWRVLAVVVPAALLLLALARTILHKYVRIMIAILDDHAPVVENGGNDGADLVGEEISFQAADGHPLEGVVITGDAPASPAGMIIFAHEFGSDRSSCKYYCRPLLQRGYDVFSFDFRGHGSSPAEPGYRPRQWPTDRECSDMLGAIACMESYLKERGRVPCVGLFGPSRGACAALLASVGVGSVRAIVTDGAFSSDATLEYLMKRFATIFARVRVVAANHPAVFWRFMRWMVFRECRRRFNCDFPSVRKALVRLGRTPILFIHGEKDSCVPVGQSQMLYKLARGPKELWVVRGAKHNQSILVDPDTYARKVIKFFNEYLPTSQSLAERAVPSSQCRRSQRLLHAASYHDVGLRVAGKHGPTAVPLSRGS